MNRNCAEVGKARFGTDRTEFRIHNSNRIIAARIFVIERFEFIDWIHAIFLLLSDPKYIYASAAEIVHEGDHAGSTPPMYGFPMRQTRAT